MCYKAQLLIIIGYVLIQLLKARYELFALLAMLLFIGLIVLSQSPSRNFLSALYLSTHTAKATASDFIHNKTYVKLTPADEIRYDEIFRMQKKADWAAADAIMNEILNPMLKGHVLGQRYLAPTYKTSKAELVEWLDNYSDLPQATRIYALAKSRGIEASRPDTTRRNLSGYGESFKNIRFESPRIAAIWRAGLSSWNNGNYSRAYERFTSLENTSSTLGDWDKSAISFWAYRAADALHDTQKAKKHLERAARFPRSFYGAQAVHILGNTLDEKVALRGKESLADYLIEIEAPQTRNALRRIQALTKIGQKELALNELVHHYALADAHDRVAFVPLANKLELPALQLRMGIDLERKGITSGEALYPMPRWEPKNGYIIDPALVFAVARQESGFNSKARSYAGAQGTMQIMPETAKYIAQKMNLKSSTNLNDPVSSMTLGQNYLNYLANKNYIQGNIVLLAVAYNAGPGNAKRWSRQPAAMNDPLYFIETIPFSETRDYVMNVMTNYWMYREIMNDNETSVTELSQNIWPTTQPMTPRLAAILSAKIRA